MFIVVKIGTMVTQYERTKRLGLLVIVITGCMFTKIKSQSEEFKRDEKTVYYKVSYQN